MRDPTEDMIRTGALEALASPRAGSEELTWPDYFATVFTAMIEAALREED